MLDNLLYLVDINMSSLYMLVLFPMHCELMCTYTYQTCIRRAVSIANAIIDSRILDDVTMCNANFCLSKKFILPDLCQCLH